MHWYPDRLLRVVLGWTLVWVTLVMLAVWRGGIDPNYIWGFVSFRGPGASNDYWGMLVLATLGWSILYIGLRGARPPFHAMLLAWNAIMTYLFTRYAVEQGASATIEGQAWGFEIRLDMLGPALFGLFTLLAAAWIVRDWRRGFPDRRVLPNPRAKRYLGVAAAMAAVLIVLWWPGVGEYDGILHATAVGFSIVQSLLIAAAMLPGKPEPEFVEAHAAAEHGSSADAGGSNPNAIDRRRVSGKPTFLSIHLRGWTMRIKDWRVRRVRPA